MTEKPLPIEKHRVMIQQAKGTVKSLLDAAVELVTNSDDSFRKLEEGQTDLVNPTINVFLHRAVGGQCIQLTISDNASGMSQKELLDAIKFGGRTSGFLEGRRVRGFFGRGLKEAIIALGEGKILTRKNGVSNAVRIWVSGSGWGRKVVYDDEITVSNEEWERWGLSQSDGTAIVISDISSNYRLPTQGTFEEQFTNHFALRDINSNPQRSINLWFTSERRGNLGPSEEGVLIKFTRSDGKVVFDEKIKFGKKGKNVAKLILRESNQPLFYSRNNPCSLAGLLVKSERAILENTLFKFGTNPAGTYFFGELFVPEIAESLRKGEGEGLISANRTGLDWRDTLLRDLAKEVEVILDPLIRNKEKDLERASDETKLSSKDQRFKKELCKLLGDILKVELKDIISPPIHPGELDGIEIRPIFANIKVGSSRSFAVYLPKWLDEIVPVSELEIRSTNPAVPVDDTNFSFHPHKEHPNLLIGRFEVGGKRVGEEAKLIVSLGEYTGAAEVRVVEELGKGKRKKYKTKKPGSLIRDIKPIESPNPIQRAYLDEDLGELKIYVNFPGVKDYLYPWHTCVNTKVGRAILGELVVEGLCRKIATDTVGKGGLLDDSADTFNSEFFNLQKKYSGAIHKFIRDFYGSS